MKTSAPSRRPILSTWISLLVLTALTTGVALANLGRMNMVVSVAIAAVQAALIAFFLMHSLHGPGLIRVVLAGGVIWFLIMETLTWADYVTRGWLQPSGK